MKAFVKNLVLLTVTVAIFLTGVELDLKCKQPTSDKSRRAVSCCLAAALFDTSELNIG